MIEDLRALIGKNRHLLEIGAGTGAFTRQLKSGLSRLAIVEPSAAMRAEFQRHWDGPDILEVLPCKWEEAPEVRVDMVFGANAFYRINDIAAALSKMNKLAQSRVALVQTVGRPHANPLTVTTDGVSRERERADALCDVLDELHIYHRRRDYEVLRPDGPSKAALIDWVPA
ncbi:MAG: class I SAM-dependent methyltransferase [Pseudomonadota bacterium]